MMRVEGSGDIRMRVRFCWGGLVRDFFCGLLVWGAAALGCGVGLGQATTTAPAPAPVPSTDSTVSQGGAGTTMLLWPAGALAIVTMIYWAGRPECFRKSEGTMSRAMVAPCARVAVYVP